MREIVLDTLGKLYAHGHGIGGYCLVCQRIFDVSVGMRPLACPGLRRAAHQVPGHGAGEGAG